MFNVNIKTQLLNNQLSFRPKLTIPESVKFGLEIELENVDFKYTYNLVKEQLGSKFKVAEDRSLNKYENAEIATPPMKNTINDWLLLKKLSELITKLNPTFDNCSFQINFDGSLLPTKDDRINLLKIFAYYEDIIYRFSKGEDESYRQSLNIYSAPIILVLKSVLDFNKDSIIDTFNEKKYYGINFKTEKQDLIECRCPNGTENIILWQNYITFFYYLIIFARSRKFNNREITEYINNFSDLSPLKSYEEINEEKSLRLSKEIFSHQKDRIYFLHQYIGNR